MTFSENISLQEYVDSANQKISEIESRFSKVEDSVKTKMNGKTTAGLIGAIFGTACWLVVFFASFWYTRGYVDRILSLVCFGIALAMVVTMFIDEIISFSYYSKITSYKNNITQLKSRVIEGGNSIKSNQDIFMESRANGWSHPLSVGLSVFEEATLIEDSIKGMELLKGRFIPGLKNILYAALVIAVTGVGSWALFETACDFILNLSDDFDSNVAMTLSILGLFAAEVGAIILAKMCWSFTNCSVTNATLLVVPVGPFLFLILTIGVSSIIMAIFVLIGVALAVGAAIIAAVCVFGMISGG